MVFSTIFRAACFSWVALGMGSGSVSSAPVRNLGFWDARGRGTGDLSSATFSFAFAGEFNRSDASTQRECDRCGNDVSQRIGIPSPSVIVGCLMKPQRDEEARDGKTLEAQGQSDGIQRDYVTNASLGKEEEKVVLELAKKRGIKKVAKISTYQIEPSPYFGIRVFGEDQIDGRDVAFESLSVTSKKWAFPEATPAPGDIRIGDYWAGRPQTRKQKILKVGGQEYRVNQIHEMTIEECEVILERLLEGKFSVATEASFGIDEIQWSRPSMFRKGSDGGIMAVFNHRGSGVGFTEVAIRVTANGLEVTPMAMAIP